MNGMAPEHAVMTMEAMNHDPTVARAAGMIAMAGAMEAPRTAGVYRSTGTGEAELVHTETVEQSTERPEPTLEAVGMARLSYDKETGAPTVTAVSDTEKEAYVAQRRQEVQNAFEVREKNRAAEMTTRHLIDAMQPETEEWSMFGTSGSKNKKTKQEKYRLAA
jgi:hypothetical protein